MSFINLTYEQRLIIEFSYRGNRSILRYKLNILFIHDFVRIRESLRFFIGYAKFFDRLE